MLKACISIELETRWSTRAELRVEAELDHPHQETNGNVVEKMFEALRHMCKEARSEDEPALFDRRALTEQHQEVGARELRLDRRDMRLEERDRAVTDREETASSYEAAASLRERVADHREREDMEREVRRQREE